MNIEYIEYVAKNLDNLDGIRKIQVAEGNANLLQIIALYENALHVQEAMASAIEYFTDMFNYYPALTSVSFNVIYHEESPCSASLFYITSHFPQYSHEQCEKAAQAESILYEDIQNSLSFIDMEVWSPVLDAMSKKGKYVLEPHDYKKHFTLEQLLSPEHLEVYNAIRFYEKTKLNWVLGEKDFKPLHKI